MGETESLHMQFVLIQTIELCLDLKKKECVDLICTMTSWYMKTRTLTPNTRFAIIGQQRNKENIWIER